MTNVVCGLIGIAGLLGGIFMLSKSVSAVHEIEALIAFLIGVVGLGMSGVISAVDGLRGQMKADAKVSVAAAGIANGTIAAPKPKPQFDWMGRRVGPPEAVDPNAVVVDEPPQVERDWLGRPKK